MTGGSSLTSQALTFPQELRAGVISLNVCITKDNSQVLEEMVLTGGSVTSQRGRGRIYNCKLSQETALRDGSGACLSPGLGWNKLNFPGKTELSWAGILGGAGVILGWEIELLETMLVFVQVSQVGGGEEGKIICAEELMFLQSKIEAQL